MMPERYRYDPELYREVVEARRQEYIDGEVSQATFRENMKRLGYSDAMIENEVNELASRIKKKN